MEEEYLYKGKPCIVVDRYVSFWVARDLSGLCFQGNPSDFIKKPETPNNVVPLHSTNNPLGNNNTPSKVVAASEPHLDKTALSAHQEGKVAINNCTPTQLSKAIRGIGKVYSTQILQRKPESGYVNWEHVVEVNKDLPVAWEEIIKESASTIAF